MLCPKCQFDNADGMNFCGKCGTKLEIFCPQCNFGNPSEYEFCGKCGSKLSLFPETPAKELSFDEKLTKIQKYLPEGITEKILSQRDRIEGERKQVTVMFCDMAGFTQLSEKLGPEAIYTIMDKVYEILIHKVHDYEGTVNEMTGDGIMAMFGAPIALEDAPQRAIRSAYAIHREMTKFSDHIKKENKEIPAIKMRIGIHTGPVVVGTLGNDLRVEFKAVGDTVNLASRMEGLAESGTTCVSEETFKLTEGFFRFEALGEKEIKGKEKPVKTYRVIAPSTRRTRFDVSAERGLTNFVGRERELELLLDGFGRVKEGRGQAFSIMAEAGVGKSRLLYEFRKAVANENVTFLEGKCLSYSRGVAYHPIIDVLKSNFDVGSEDKDSEIREKLKKGLKILGADEASTFPYLLELFSVKGSGIEKIAMSPEEKKHRITETIKEITIRGSEIRPLIIAIEDLHWVDKSSENYLKDLLDSISGSRILLIFTFRPEFVQTWGGKSYHNQLNLNRLSNRESLMMAAHILGSEKIDGDLEQLILEKAEGVPFFIEEFVKSLIDIKIIEWKDNKFYFAKDINDLTVPSTIQDVIMARIDSLPESAKEVLQTGSAIDREFAYDLIKQVTKLTEKELLSNLSILKDSELLVERGIYPNSRYIFKHALTREVLYDSVITQRKKKIHRKIGNAIEILYKDQMNEYYGVLAEHYNKGANYEKGVLYSTLAIEVTEKTGSINEAIAHAWKRVESLERLPQLDDVNKRLIKARTALGLYLLRILYYSEAKKAIDPIIDLAMNSGQKEPLPGILTIIGSHEFFVEENVSKAFKKLEKAYKIAKELKDDISIGFTSLRLGVALGLNCEFEKATYYFKKALSVNMTTNTLWALSITNSYLSYFSYFRLGNINMANQASAEAIRLSNEGGDIYSKAFAYTARGIAYWGKGFLENAKKHLLKGFDYCDKINFLLWKALASRHLGEVYYEIGDYKKSKDYYTQAAFFIEKTGSFSSFLALMKTCIEMAKVKNNENDLDFGSLYAYSRSTKIKIYEALNSIYMGEILANIDDDHLTESESWFNKAIEMHKRYGMIWYVGRDYALYAELFKRKGNLPKAKENLNKAIENFKECGADGWVEKYEQKLTALS